MSGISNNQGNTLDFYIWDKQRGSGHVGIGYTTEAGERKYQAIWPTNDSILAAFAASSFGLVFGIPCRSLAVDSFEQDLEKEERQPDCILRVPANPEAVQSAAEYIRQRKWQSDTGVHMYSLSPNFLWSFRAVQLFASRFPSEPTPDQEMAMAKGDAVPVSGDDELVEKRLQSTQWGHCATEGYELAKIAAEHNQERAVSSNWHLPYGYRPKDIINLVEGFQGVQIERPEQPESGRESPPPRAFFGR